MQEGEKNVYQVNVLSKQSIKELELVLGQFQLITTFRNWNWYSNTWNNCVFGIGLFLKSLPSITKYFLGKSMAILSIFLPYFRSFSGKLNEGERKNVSGKHL